MLYTEQDTGIKLKLLNSLFTGRYCIVNHKMADNTGLEGFCHIANNAAQFIKLVKEYWEKPFLEQERADRIEFFSKEFNNTNTVNELLNAIPFESIKSEIIIKPIQKPTVKSRVAIGISFLIGIFT